MRNEICCYHISINEVLKTASDSSGLSWCGHCTAQDRTENNHITCTCCCRFC